MRARIFLQNHYDTRETCKSPQTGDIHMYGGHDDTHNDNHCLRACRFKALRVFLLWAVVAVSEPQDISQTEPPSLHDRVSLGQVAQTHSLVAEVLERFNIADIEENVALLRCQLAKEKRQEAGAHLSDWSHMLHAATRLSGYRNERVVGFHVKG
jgi:hypothetical protein